MNDTPTPLVVHCECGERATSALRIGILSNGQSMGATAYVCTAHVGKVEIEDLSAAPLPTYMPMTVDLSETWPPLQGQIHLGDGIVLCCPLCATTVSLLPPLFRVEGDKLTPSFVCTNCDFHAWLSIATAAKAGK